MNTQNSEETNFLVYVEMAVIACLRAFLNCIFVYPNNFAPAGIGGIATMLQYVTNINVGYFYFLLNLPLLILGFTKLSKAYAFKTATYVTVFSVVNIFFKNLNLGEYAFVAKDAGESILAAIAAGVVAGLELSTCIRLGGSTGGTDIVSAYINKINPMYDMVWINFALNAAVASSSFFVYGKKYTPVILCIIYMYVDSRLSDMILKGAKTAIKFEVFTHNPEEMSQRLIKELKHGVTVVNAEGMYHHQNLALLICIVNKHQVVDFENIIKDFEGSFAVISSVNSTYGNFKKIK